MTTRPTQAELRERYVLDQLKMHSTLNKELKAINVQPKANCSVAIKAAYEHGIINTPKVNAYTIINKMGNKAKHEFNEPLPAPPQLRVHTR